jgi:predicted acyltransferase
MAGKGKVERRGVGVLYAELRNFTRLSEVLDPAKVMELANEFFALAARHMGAHSGRVLAVHNDSMLGIFTGRWLASQRPLMERLAAMFAIGSIGMVLGLMWNWVFPINKNLWTSSYVVFTAGMAAVVLATCVWLIDAKRVTWWTKPFVIYGMNPILAFVGSGMMARLMGSIIKVEQNGQRVSLQKAIYDSSFASWLAPMNASLLYAVCFVVFWFGILALLHHKKIFLKV